MLFVTRSGVRNFSSAATAKKSLERCDQNILGLVVNGVLPENEPDSYFYYTDDYSGKENSRISKQTTSKAGKYAA